MTESPAPGVLLPPTASKIEVIGGIFLSIIAPPIGGVVGIVLLAQRKTRLGLTCVILALVFLVFWMAVMGSTSTSP